MGQVKGDPMVMLLARLQQHDHSAIQLLRDYVRRADAGLLADDVSFLNSARKLTSGPTTRADESSLPSSTNN